MDLEALEYVYLPPGEMQPLRLAFGNAVELLAKEVDCTSERPQLARVGRSIGVSAATVLESTTGISWFYGLHLDEMALNAEILIFAGVVVDDWLEGLQYM